MIRERELHKLLCPDLPAPTLEDMRPAAGRLQLRGVPWARPSDIAEAAAWLASRKARYVTGVEFRVDAGNLTK
ncbi:SDR family oxidoreductase [Streptomyces sp. NPDC001970]